MFQKAKEEAKIPSVLFRGMGRDHAEGKWRPSQYNVEEKIECGSSFTAAMLAFIAQTSNP